MRHDVVHRLKRPRRNFAAGRQGASGDAIVRHSLLSRSLLHECGLPWYAVRAYYFGGPWSYGYSGWTDYAARNGIGCVPASLVKGGDGHVRVPIELMMARWAAPIKPPVALICAQEI